MMTAMSNPDAIADPRTDCVICCSGLPLDVIAELEQVWVTAGRDAPLPGYVCLVSKTRLREPYQLPEPERRAFWRDVDDVAAALDSGLRPSKLNYEIHGNTIPHLHLHLFPRYRGDRFEGRPIDARETEPRSERDMASLREAVEGLIRRWQDVALGKERGAREIAEIDARLERGEIDEDGWHAAMAELIAPAYIAAETPWGGSGYGGSREDWEYARSHIAHAIEGPGSFLDVGCANGFLLECLPRWTAVPLDRWGLDIDPALVERARGRGRRLTWRSLSR
jgi:diadenosine tetraphosphate (Ap4A) HIT family hydrolase